MVKSKFDFTAYVWYIIINMKLIKEIESKRDKKGNLVKWGIFQCPINNEEVEMRLSDGYKCKSCGCNRNKNNKYRYTHGGKGTKLYNVWCTMKQRILNPNNTDYKDYGGRGIIICPEWVNDYVVFRDWSLSHEYAEGLQINRIENNGNYEPSNCNWITQTENLKNKRNSIPIEIANEIMDLYDTGKYTQKELAEIYDVSQKSISNIINNKTWR